jgi:acyl carrier protein
MVLDKLREALASQFEVDADTISAETDISVDLGADSLDLFELIMTLEDEYGLSITDEAVYSYKTVGEIASYIESLIDNK